MTDDKYRKELSAILEGINMPQFERLLLIGGLVQEIRAAQGPEIGKLRGQVAVAHRVFEAWTQLGRSINNLGEALEEYDGEQARPD